MSKNWRYQGFTTEYTYDLEAQKNTAINQGKFLLKIANKIEAKQELSALETEFACASIRAIAEDLIKNPEKRLATTPVGRNFHPNRYEILRCYYNALKALKKKSHARFFTACHYLFSVNSTDTDEEKIIKLEENIRSWEKADSVDNHIKREVDNSLDFV